MRFVLRLPSLQQLRRDRMLPAVLVSIGLHLGMVAVGFAAMRWGSDAPVPLPVYTVSLVDLPQSDPAPARGPQGDPAPPVHQEEAPPPPEPEADSPLQAVPEVPPEKKPEPAKKKTPPRPEPQPPAEKPRQQTATPSAATTPSR